MKKMVLSVVVLLTMVGAYALIVGFSPYGESDVEGHIGVRVVDASGQTVIDDTLPFHEGDTMFEVLNQRYELTLKTFASVGGRALLGIDDVVTDFVSDFLHITLHYPVRENGEIIDYDVETAMSGIDGLSLRDGMIIVFTVTTVGGGSP